MVAHCSDFFHVCASSSFLVLTASSSRLMLSCKKPKGRFYLALPKRKRLLLTGFFFLNIKTCFRGNFKNLTQCVVAHVCHPALGRQRSMNSSPAWTI
jgi:hypothetical protein